MHRNEETLTRTGLHMVSHASEYRIMLCSPRPLRIALHNVHAQHRVRSQKAQGDQEDAQEQHDCRRSLHVIAHVAEQDTSRNTAQHWEDEIEQMSFWLSLSAVTACHRIRYFIRDKAAKRPHEGCGHDYRDDGKAERLELPTMGSLV